jgi:outer membrane protein TolC
MKPFIFLYLLIAGSLAVSSTETHPTYLSFEDSVKLALDGNPDLAVVRAQEEAIKLRSRQALAPGDPVFSYQAQDTPGFNPGIQPAEAVYQINFTLGFPGKALAQSANLRHQAEATMEIATAKEIDLITTLSNVYVSFFINDTYYQLYKDEDKRDERLLHLLEKKFGASQAAKVDLLNAKVVMAQLQEDLLANRNEYEVLTTQFRQTIKKPDRGDLYPKVPKEIIVPELKLTFEELSRLMLKNSHNILGADHQVEAAESALTLASLQPLPDFQLMTSVNVWNTTQGPPISGVTRDYTFGIGIAVPLFFPFSQLTGIKAARKDVAVADFQDQSQKLTSIANLQTTYTSFRAAQKETDNLSKLVVPAAKASYDLTLLTYSLGRGDFFQLGVSRKAWFDSQKDLLAKKQSVAQFYNQFITEVGCDFAKREGPHACHE